MSEATATREGMSAAEIEAVLEKRARALAAAPAHEVLRPLLATTALVGVGAEVFGVPVEGVREIVKVPPITPLPGTPEWIRGVAQVRGEILCAVDLGRWFKVEGRQEPAYLVVLAGLEAALGLLVDTVNGFTDIHADEVVGGLRESHGGRPVLATTVALVSVLDLPALASSADLIVGARPAESSPSGESYPGVSVPAETG